MFSLESFSNRLVHCFQQGAGSYSGDTMPFSQWDPTIQMTILTLLEQRGVVAILVLHYHEGNWVALSSNSLVWYSNLKLHVVPYSSIFSSRLIPTENAVSKEELFKIISIQTQRTELFVHFPRSSLCYGFQKALKFAIKMWPGDG
jgi:hypothetical protein